MIVTLAAYLAIGFIVALATVIAFSWYDTPDNISSDDTELLFTMAVTGIIIMCFWPVVLLGALFAVAAFYSSQPTAPVNRYNVTD